MEAKIYNQKGVSNSSVTLPEAIFGLPWNADLVHQVVTGMMSNARVAVADTKGRGEVRGGGKKPWKQKGTGRARHGSIRSPLWKGGGVTHGPLSEKNYKKKINKKMKMKALFTVLSEKLRRNEIIFVDSLSIDAIKTKSANEIVSAISKGTSVSRIATKRKNAMLLALPARDSKVEKSFANLPQVETVMIKDINPVELLQKSYLVVVSPDELVATMTKKMEK